MEKIASYANAVQHLFKILFLLYLNAEKNGNCTVKQRGKKSEI